MTDRNMNDCNNHMPVDPPGTLRQNQMIHRPTSHPQQHHPRVPHAAPEENGRELYPPSRMIIPPSLSLVNHPRLFSDECIGHGSNRLHPDTLHRQNEFVDQDSRRFQVNNIPRMMQPNPRYQELSYPVALLPSPPPFAPSQRGYQRNNEQSFAASAALTSDDRPRSLYAEGKDYYHGLNSNSTGPDMIHQAPAQFHHDNRRLNVGDGVHTTLLRQPNLNHPLDVSHQFNRGYQLDNPLTMFAATRNKIQDRPPSQTAPPRHNSLPGLLRHPDEGEHVGDSARYSSMNRPAHNPESKYSHQDRKRLKTDEGIRSVVRHSSNQTGPAQPLMVRASRQEQSNSSNDNRPRLLWVPDDEKHLTELHCFVRKHCVFIFSATSKDVGTPRKGRKKALRLGQIGIGCLYCSSAENKLKGSTYFPTCISGIYNATMIIQQRHFAVCPFVSREDFAKYNALKGLTARSASTKEYWILAAKKLGLVDTVSGVFFQSSIHTGSSHGASLMPIGVPQAVLPLPPQGPLPSLVEPSDKVFATEYSYFVVEQMTTCEFTEADRLGKRKCHKIGFPGMACRHCFGCNGSGRFFPLTLKTFSDVSKSIHVLRNHLVKCTKAPSWLAQTVNNLYEQHKEEKLTTPFGSQKIFFDLIWRRLHGELHLDISTEGVVGDDLPTAAAPPKQFSRQERGQKKRATLDSLHHQTIGQSTGSQQQEVADNTLTATTPVQSPPVIHRGKTIFRPDEQETECDDNDKDNRSLLCMIPKKRYLYSQSSTTSIVMPQNASDLGLTPPTTLLRKHKYTEGNDQYKKSDDHRKSDDQRNPQHYQQSLSSPPSPRQQVTNSYSESPPSKTNDASPPSTLDDNNNNPQQVSYSEHDVSIAMILANGFGKKTNANKDWGEKKKDTASSSVADEQPKRAEV